ncbi:MAG: 5'(3')-deoxyribonucleotidase [Phaeodactylibacter sp.]|nr:5'(3')-deoxyribonucleotidase [Phaeodactylibacter sp.]
MKRIAVDMDEVLADIVPKLLDLYEEYFGTRLEKEEYWGAKIYARPDAARIRERLFEPGFFADLPVIEGAQEGIRFLQEHYEVYIVTAASEFRNAMADKHDWLQTHFPSIHWKQMIFCGDKSVIGTDYMLDDHAFNLETFQGKGLLFTAYHNTEETRFPRLNNWKEVIAYFQNELSKEAV